MFQKGSLTDLSEANFGTRFIFHLFSFFLFLFLFLFLFFTKTLAWATGEVNGKNIYTQEKSKNGIILFNLVYTPLLTCYQTRLLLRGFFCFLFFVFCFLYFFFFLIFFFFLFFYREFAQSLEGTLFHLISSGSDKQTLVIIYPFLFLPFPLFFSPFSLLPARSQINNFIHKLKQ